MSEGCSGSSATVRTTNQLLEAHGIRVATGPRKKQCSNGAHCANRAQESELFKCEKNPFCARPGTPCGTVTLPMTPHGDGNVTAAMIGVVAEAVADGLSLVVKSESNWGEAGRLGFGVMRQLGTHAVIAWRSNSLSKLVCSARDCFGHLGDAAYHPVQLTGPNEHACFERRKLPSHQQSHVWLNVSALSSTTCFCPPSPTCFCPPSPTCFCPPSPICFYPPPLWQVSSLVDRTLTPMQRMPETLAGHLISHGWGMLNGRLATDGGTVATVTTESLLGHQASNESAVFERGVAAWSSVLASIGVQPQERLVRRELSAQRGARPGTSIRHALDKSCTDDVTTELKRAGQPYDHMVEGNAEL